MRIYVLFLKPLLPEQWFGLPSIEEMLHTRALYILQDPVNEWAISAVHTSDCKPCLNSPGEV